MVVALTDNDGQRSRNASGNNSNPRSRNPSGISISKFAGYVHWGGGYSKYSHDRPEVVAVLAAMDEAKLSCNVNSQGLVSIPLKGEQNEPFISESGSTTPTACCAPEIKEEPEAFRPSWRAHITLLLLLMANLLNYMDRYTIAGVLMEVQSYFNISNAKGGLLQTSFICSYMVLSPAFGYMGDRYNRKFIMAVGILFWSGVTLAGSFMRSDQFYLFLFLRGMVGIGEASYSTIAPTIIADLFVGNQRTMALAIFYFAIPVGSGMGYIVGSNVAKALGSWQWALRVTPILGVVCTLLIIFVCKEPARGASEGGSHLGQTSWGDDIRYLCKNKSFMFSSFGFTCVAFVAGALSLWAPKFVDYSIRVQGQFLPDAQVSLWFGIITCLAGFLGVGLGTFAAGQLRKTNPRADPLVCAFGLISCAPFLFLALYVAQFHTVSTWCLIFIGETFLCLNWAIVTDIVLYVVIPTRRSTAEAFQILLSHLLGDAGSPYLVGVVSDHLKTSLAQGDNNFGEVAQEFFALQYSLYVCCFVAVIGGGFFLITALVIVKDKAETERATKGELGSRAETSRMIGDVSDTSISGPDQTPEPETLIVNRPSLNGVTLNHTSNVSVA